MRVLASACGRLLAYPRRTTLDLGKNCIGVHEKYFETLMLMFKRVGRMDGVGRTCLSYVEVIKGESLRKEL